jgi:hypothetical protein
VRPGYPEFPGKPEPAFNWEDLTPHVQTCEVKRRDENCNEETGREDKRNGLIGLQRICKGEEPKRMERKGSEQKGKEKKRSALIQVLETLK